jgi:hypothetical protein
LIDCRWCGPRYPHPSTQPRAPKPINTLYNFSEPDKLHLNFCKFLLGVHKKSSNFAVMPEFGRVPFYINMIKSMLLYWHRLKNYVNNSLLYNAFTDTKALSTSRDSWFSCILEFFNILEISSLSLSKFKFIVNNQICKQFIYFRRGIYQVKNIFSQT